MPAPSKSSYFPLSLDKNAPHHSPGAPISDQNRVGDDGGSRALLIGASDLGRLGDLLRPHVFSRMFEFDAYRCAGLVSKNLTNTGAHDVLNFGESALEIGTHNLNLVHLGGDNLLTGLVSGYQRASMGNESNRFTSLVQITARNEMLGYVKRRSGQTSSLGYVLAPKGCYSGSEVSFFGLRIPEPTVLEDTQEEHLVYCAGEAAFVGVSGKTGQAFLDDRGIKCHQMPCGLSALPQLCGPQLEKAKGSVVISELNERFAKGWIAVEVGEIPESQEIEFAQAVSSFAAVHGWGIAVYSSNLSEDQEVAKNKWEKLLGQIGEATWFGTKNIWELATMIGQSSCYIGSCLDSRIIASSLAVPRINLGRDDRRVTDYCDVWEHADCEISLDRDSANWGAQLENIISVNPNALRGHAEATVQALFDAISVFVESSNLNRKTFAGETVDHFEAFLHGQQIAEDWMQNDSDRESFSKINRSRGKRQKPSGVGRKSQSEAQISAAERTS